MRRDGELVNGFGYDKVKALFSFLVVERAFPFNRDVLAGMFWPEQSEENARHSLRQAISQLRSLLEIKGSSALILADRTTIQRNPHAALVCDVYRFLDFIKQADMGDETELEYLELAAAIYRGKLLKGLSLAQTESFEDWLTSSREYFHQHVVEALEKITIHYEHKRNYARLKQIAERWVNLEPWREEAHRKLMLALARTGRRTAALMQYKLCSRAISQEFGLLPDAETESLHRRILAMGAPRPSLPVLTTPLIGRRSEKKRLSQLMADSQVRLVTITGPGGTGKTHLALQFGTQAIESGSRIYLNGVAFVPLDGLSSPNGIPYMIAQALSFSFRKGTNPVDQLVQHLRDKEMLVILDNLEHLLGKDSAGLVQQLLDGARDIKILATSRQKLSLRSETVLTLGGLATPLPRREMSKPTPKDMRASGAVKLFTTLLTRVRGESSLSEQDFASLVRICQLVEGMPLAIELAVALAGSYSLPEIALSIEESLEFLRADIYDLPDRHRSIHAAIDASWGLLEEQERSIFKRLCLFRGGFTLHAAQEVSGAARETLSRLVNKSFLRYDTRSARFEIHELLRQYGYEKLAADPMELARVREKHGLYFSAYLLSSCASFFSPREVEALKDIEIENPNLLAAWSWAVDQKPADLAELAAPLHHFYLRRARFHEGIQAFQLGIDRLASGDMSHRHSNLAWLQAYQANLYTQAVDVAIGLSLLKAGLEQTNPLKPGDEQARRLRAFCLSRLGANVQEEGTAQAYLEESLSLYRELGDKSQVSYVLTHLGDLHRIFGKLDQSDSALQESLAIQQELGSDLDKVRTLNIISLYAMRRGDLKNIEPPLKEAVDIARQGGDQDQLGKSLETLGIGLTYLGRFAQAQEAVQESLEIRTEIDQRNNLVICNYFLAASALHQGKTGEAKAFAQLSIQLAKNMDDPLSSATGLWMMGQAMMVDHSYEEARFYLESSISANRTGWQQDWQSRQGIVYAVLAILDCRQEKVKLAREHIQQGLERVVETQSYFGLLHIFQAFCVYLVALKRIELGLEIYTMLMTQPFIRNSTWINLFVGQEVERAAKLLDSRVALDCRRAGQSRDFWQTALQMSNELVSLGAH